MTASLSGADDRTRNACTATLATAGRGPGGRHRLATLAVLGLVVAALVLGADGWRRGALLLVGGALGATLYLGAFGFASAYRRMIVSRDIAGVAAQLLMVAAATVLFAPVLAQGSALGEPVGGALAPVGLQVAIGAFLFGIGMQLGGACGSGCLYTAGGGSARAAIAVVAFCAGAFIGSPHMHWWAVLPGWDAVSLSDLFGWEAALPLQLSMIAVLFLGLRAWAAGRPIDLRASRPLLIAALLLAGLNWLTLILAGHPWTVTWAFSLWGAKAPMALGWDPAASPFWSGGFPGAALAASVLEDTTSLMNFGILGGAFRPSLRIRPTAFAAAIIGGLAMGYGARLGYGCNIGAFFSGVASTSLHGWLWIAAALAGTTIGVRLRPLFGLSRD